MDGAIFLSISVGLLLLLIFAARSLLLTGQNGRLLPPGSFGWPFIGETLEFLFGSPEKFVGDRMRMYSPEIFKTKILGEKTAVICGSNGHKFLFSNEQKLFTEFRPHSIQHLFRLRPSKSLPGKMPDTTIRQPGFLKPEALTRFLAVMDSTSSELLRDHWKGKTEVKAYPLAKLFTLTLSSKFLAGIENPSQIAKLVDCFDHVTLGLHSVMVNIPGTNFYRAKKAAAAIRKELVAVIREKKSGKDVLSHLIAHAGQTDADRAEIAGQIMGLIVAGYSTVATTLTFFIKHMGERPDVYDKVRAEQIEIARSKKAGEPLGWEDMQKMKYSWNVVCETMRLTPPLQGTFREVLTDFTYAGYTVPKGWKVYWTVSSTNMNSKYFKYPEKFDPSRFEDGGAHPPYTYVPFGGGPRMCPGKEYSRLVILAFVYNVVRNYKWELLFPDEKVTGDMMPSPEKGLPLRLHPLHSSA